MNQIKPNEILLTKLVLGVFSGLLCLAGGYFTLENRLIGLSIGCLLGTAIVYRSYRSTIHKVRGNDTELIFGGFRIRNSILYILISIFWIYLFYKENKGYQYLFIGLFFLASTLDDALRLIVFNYSKKLVSGLIDDNDKEMNKMSIEVLEANKIKVTDTAGFYHLSKADFTESTWVQLLENLERVKSGM